MKELSGLREKKVERKRERERKENEREGERERERERQTDIFSSEIRQNLRRCLATTFAGIKTSPPSRDLDI